MANRLSRIEVGIPTASSDGRYYGRYPAGDRPSKALAAAAVAAALATGTFAGGPAVLASAAATSSVATASFNSIAADYAARIAAGRTFFATDFSGAGDFDQTNHVFGENGGGQTSAYWKSLVTKDTTDPRAPACLKILSPAMTWANGAAWFGSMNQGGLPGSSALGTWSSDSAGMGNTPFYVFWRFKIPSTRLIVRHSQGWKYFDISCYAKSDPQNLSQSNVPWEVISQAYWTTFSAPRAYHQGWLQPPQGPSDAGYPPFGEFSYGPPINDIRVTDTDNGAGAGDNLHRYCLYNGGNLSPGCFLWFTDEWLNFKQYIVPNTYGGQTGNVFGMWAARQDSTSWTTLYDPAIENDFGFGSGPVAAAGFTSFNGFWLNAYETLASGDGPAPGDVDTYQKWWQVMASLDDIPLPSVGC